jgi:alpha-L-rhamnosidase
MDVVIPANTYATVYIPTTNAAAVTENNKNITSIKEIEVLGAEKGYVVVKVGSGSYHFEFERSVQ